LRYAATAAAAGHKYGRPGARDLIRLLVEPGARLDIRDTLWDGTLGWAIHNKKAKAEAYLRSLLAKG
jgi:hypothetical protein